MAKALWLFLREAIGVDCIDESEVLTVADEGAESGAKSMIFCAIYWCIKNACMYQN